MTEEAEEGRHGTYASYVTDKCRCRPCLDARNVYMRAWRQRNKESLSADPQSVTHGLRDTYVNHGCRCDPCKGAAREAYAVATIRAAAMEEAATAIRSTAIPGKRRFAKWLESRASELAS